MKRHSLSIDVVQGKKDSKRTKRKKVFIYERKKIEKKNDQKKKIS